MSDECARCGYTPTTDKPEGELAVHEAWCEEVETIVLRLRVGFAAPAWATRHQIAAAEKRLRDVEEDADWVQTGLPTDDSGGACP